MNPRKRDDFISREWCEAPACEACGQAFTCGAASQGCWCAEIKLSDEVSRVLSARYRRCLCRTCLESFVQTSVTSASCAGGDSPAREEMNEATALKKQPR